MLLCTINGILETPHPPSCGPVPPSSTRGLPCHSLPDLKVPPSIFWGENTPRLWLVLLHLRTIHFNIKHLLPRGAPPPPLGSKLIPEWTSKVHRQQLALLLQGALGRGANTSSASVTLCPACVDSHLKRYHLSFVSLSLNEKGQAGSTSLIQRQWECLVH